MSSRDQLSTKTGVHSGKVLPEGFITAKTSAGNTLAFESPAAFEEYRRVSAAQMNVKI